MPLPTSVKEHKTKPGKLIIIPIAAAALAFSFSCGPSDNNTQTQTTPTYAHQLAPEQEARVISDAKADLQVITAAGKDTSTLSQAMSGSALAQMQATISQDLAQGKYRKRVYDNIHVVMQDYTDPYASVFVEFDDKSYYVDAGTGTPLDQPQSQHKAYAMALVQDKKDNNRWKINMILAPQANGTSTTPGQ